MNSIWLDSLLWTQEALWVYLWARVALSDAISRRVLNLFQLVLGLLTFIRLCSGTFSWISCGMAAVITALFALFWKRGLWGGADLKLGFLLFTWLGLGQGLISLTFACLLGLAQGLLIVGIKTFRSTQPLRTHLSQVQLPLLTFWVPVAFLGQFNLTGA